MARKLIAFNTKLFQLITEEITQIMSDEKEWENAFNDFLFVFCVQKWKSFRARDTEAEVFIKQASQNINKHFFALL